MGSKAKRAAREMPYRAERERVVAMQSAERIAPNVRGYDAMTVIKMTVPGDINTTRGDVVAPVKIPKVHPASSASAEDKHRWADKAAVEAKLAKQAERDRKAAKRMDISPPPSQRKTRDLVGWKPDRSGHEYGHEERYSRRDRLTKAVEGAGISPM
jgi:hypothetical protein